MKPHVVFISTFPPRECGIATFTRDLTKAITEVYGHVLECKIAAINPNVAEVFKYPPQVSWQINEDNGQDFKKLADAFNANPQVQLINVQHEYGIFGRRNGESLLDFLEAIKKPVVITFHTVLPHPEGHWKVLTQRLASHAQIIIVMTELSRKILVRDYGIIRNKIRIVPHGIQAVPYEESGRFKKNLKIGKRTILLSFGLLNPNKGIEYVLDALPEIVKKFHDVLYLVVGATHPVVLRKYGEKYRNFLAQKVKKLKIANNVQFYNKYVNLPELIQFLGACDIYLGPSLDPNQAVSGTLSYALGTGRPVIATSFSQAREQVSNEVGILVKFRNAESIRSALYRLLADRAERNAMGKKAYILTRKMIWPNVALVYAGIFSQFIPQLRNEEKRLPPVKLSHLIKFTDNFGIVQFAKLTEPDRASGYTVDDNARALIALTQYYELHPTKYLANLISHYLKFLEFTSQNSGHFTNYVNEDRTINKVLESKENPEDPTARALLALAVVATSQKIPGSLKQSAEKLFERSSLKNPRFHFPRPISYYVKALSLMVASRVINPQRNGWKKTLAKHADFLLDMHKEASSHDWQWFENALTYNNGSLPEALLWAYEATKKEKYFEVAKRTVNFLVEKTFRDGTYLPIGQNGWYRRAGKRTYFDQQPEDVSATVQMLAKLFEITGDNHYKKLMFQAFSWFLGDNILKQSVYDRTTGGCYDGVREKNINLNQGAESTISYLLARLAFE